MTALLAPHGRGSPAARRPDAETLDDLRAFGADTRLLEKLAARGEAEEAADDDEADPHAIRLWPENVPSARLMIALETQWRVVVGMSAVLVTGLDYGVVRETARMAEIPMTPERFADLQACEAALLPLLNAKRR